LGGVPFGHFSKDTFGQAGPAKASVPKIRKRLKKACP